MRLVGFLRSARCVLRAAFYALRSNGLRYAPFVVALLLGLGFALLYVRTAAPSVLSGDSAEFQFAAPLLAVPHPTGYPLYTLLGYLASRLPGDSARRVTQVSALAGAVTVVLLFGVALRLTRSLLAALIAALALGLSPGLWNAATLAEVYALNALFVAALGLGLLWARDQAGGNELTASALVGLLCGLGVSHHSSFVFSAAPLAAAYGLMRLIRSRRRLAVVLALLGGGLLGLTPWLYPLVQYARFGPFDGADHGLPRFYFWGAPRSWAQALGHLDGSGLREGVVVEPSLTSLAATLDMIGERLWFEFGLGGLVLGVLGCGWLCRRDRLAWGASLWLIGGTTLFLALLGPSVQDAPVFTLPLVLPWTLWVGCGALALAEWAGRLQKPHSRLLTALPTGVLLLCLALTLAWGQSRWPYANKAGLWLFRSYGEQVLGKLEPRAALITSWEQGTTLRYLILVEHQRPDVWVDIVEPGDVSWAQRVRRYRGRPVYLLGHPNDIAGSHSRLVWAQDYGNLYLVQSQ